MTAQQVWPFSICKCVTCLSASLFVVLCRRATPIRPAAQGRARDRRQERRFSGARRGHTGDRSRPSMQNIPAADARRTIDVSSLYVTPGLVDMHVHVFAGSMDREYTGENCVRPDGFTFRSGVTTVVDAGSSGWRNFGEFRDQIINKSKTRVFAMLNIVGSGMGGRPDVEQNTKDMEPERTAEVAKRNSDVVVGIKVAHYAGPEWIAVDRGGGGGRTGATSR